MEALKYLKEKERMCEKIGDCNKCLLLDSQMGNCIIREKYHPEKAVEIVEKWSVENPQKTILQDFLEKYPNALLNEDGTPESCCKNLGFPPIGYCFETPCKDCWNRPLEG